MALDDLNQPLWFLAAKTPEELHLLMKMNNTRFNQRFHYLPPTFAKGKWYTWFEIRPSVLAEKEMNDGDS